MIDGPGNSTTKIYAVRGWDEYFECSQSRRLQSLNWFQMPNRLDSDGYCELMMEDEGPAHYGVWCAMLALASKGEPRGVFIRKTGQPHTPKSVAMVIRMPLPTVQAAWDAFIAIGWLVEWDAGAAQLRELESQKRKQRHSSSRSPAESESSESRTCVERASNMSETHDTNQPTNQQTNRGKRASAQGTPISAAEPLAEENQPPGEDEPWEGVVRIWNRVFEELESTSYAHGPFCVRDGMELSKELTEPQREFIEPAIRSYLKKAKAAEKTLSRFRRSSPGLIAEQAKSHIRIQVGSTAKIASEREYREQVEATAPKEPKIPDTPYYHELSQRLLSNRGGEPHRCPG